MDLDNAALNHARNVIRRQVQEEIPILVPLFILHKDRQRENALARAKNEILQNINGEDVFKNLAKYKSGNKTEFPGIRIERKSGFLFVPDSLQLFAFLFINIETFQSLEEARFEMYHMAWHALKLAQNYLSGKNRKTVKSKGLIRTQHTRLSRAQENLMADVFAAFMVELQGKKGFIIETAQKRILETFTPSPASRSDMYPLPIATDTLKFVHDDLFTQNTPKSRIIRQSIQIAEEIGDTHSDENAVRQWWILSEAAQEMAWLGFDLPTILSTAIHTSEDPHVRATAYQAAENLGIDPKLPEDLGNYNPFTDQEANERLHKRKCDSRFEALFPAGRESCNLKKLREEIQNQNQKLIKGAPVGWFGHVLCAIIQAHETPVSADGLSQESLKSLYGKTLKDVPWKTLRKLNKALLKAYKSEHYITARNFSAFLAENPEFKTIRRIFEKYGVPE